MFLTLADDLLHMDVENSQPRDLPGRYGRVIGDLELLLKAAGTTAVVAGGWAVWRHGYVGRVTQDVDIVVPADGIESLRKYASLFDFEPLANPKGRWPKLIHKSTLIEVDILPEAGVPGVAARPAPVAIRHPSFYGAKPTGLEYIEIAGLFELKLGSHRQKDIADLVELLKVHTGNRDEIRKRLSDVHPQYAREFDALIDQANSEST